MTAPYLTPADEAAIERSVRQRSEQAAADARAAQPHCCPLYWREHTRACPNRTYDSDWRALGRFVRRLGWRMLRGLMR